MVEHLVANEMVVGSSPITRSIFFALIFSPYPCFFVFSEKIIFLLEILFHVLYIIFHYNTAGESVEPG